MPSQPSSTDTDAVRLAQVFVRLPKEHQQENIKPSAPNGPKTDSSDVSRPPIPPPSIYQLTHHHPDHLPLEPTTAQTFLSKERRRQRHGTHDAAKANQNLLQPPSSTPNPRPNPDQVSKTLPPNHPPRPANPLPQTPPYYHRTPHPTALPAPALTLRVLIDAQIFSRLPARGGARGGGRCGVVDGAEARCGECYEAG